MAYPTFAALNRLAVGALLMAPLFLEPASIAYARSRRTVCRITAVKARLFYSRTGTFSSDVFEEAVRPPLIASLLWNTPIKDDPSSSVLVVVEIAGEMLYTREPQLEFTARYRPPYPGAREVVIRRRVKIHSSGFGEAAKGYEGFWLYDTGCFPVKLSVRLMGQAPVLKTINFGCGE
jgi:hypothetical protein